MDIMSKSDLGITAVIDIIQDSTWQGIALPAHVTSKKGIFKDMGGQKRIKLIQHPGLLAMEDRWQPSEDAECKDRPIIDWLNGTDPQYRRQLAVYQASDNPSGLAKGGHGLQGIGSRFTYFKMEQINLESLRQCFLDRDVRIKQDFEFEQHEYPRIGKVTISGGFLEGQSVNFNQGLNSINWWERHGQICACRTHAICSRAITRSSGNLERS